MGTRIDKFERNVIINGNMELWQREVNFANPAGAYTADRFFVSRSGNHDWDIARVTSAPSVAESGFKSPYSLRVDSNISATLGASDLAQIIYRIEGYDLIPLWGNKTLLSFWVRSNRTGIYSLAAKNSVPDQAYISEFTIDVANTWERKTVVLDLRQPPGTFLFDNGIGLELVWTLQSGATYQTGTLDQWHSGNFIASTNQTDWGDDAADYFELAQVLLLPGEFRGDVLPDFRRAGRDFSEELAKAQRYFEKSYPLGVFPGAAPSYDGFSMAYKNSSGTYMYSAVDFSVRKRIATWSGKTYGIVTGNVNAVNSWVGEGEVGGGPHFTTYQGETSFGIVSSSGTPYAAAGMHTFHWTADAEL